MNLLGAGVRPPWPLAWPRPSSEGPQFLPLLSPEAPNDRSRQNHISNITKYILLYHL